MTKLLRLVSIESSEKEAKKSLALMKHSDKSKYDQLSHEETSILILIVFLCSIKVLTINRENNC
jgi:hypothetical protein